MKKKWKWIAAGGAVLVVLFLFWRFSGMGKTQQVLTTESTKGKFEVIVTTTGELRAKNQTDLNAPIALRSLNIYQIKIADLVTEGTTVKAGDFVASLDKTEIMQKLSEESLNLQKIESQYKESQLDTTLTMRTARDELINLKYLQEEKKLEMQQSKYEAPAIQRQAEIEFEKAERNFTQQKENLLTKEAQARTKMQIIGSDLSKARNKVEEFMALMGQLDIMAPEDGMVIYAKDWDGRKRVVGASVSIWDPTVATLPDLTVMEVVTYVNEVDIKKIKEGLTVDIGLDSDPDKKLQGKVKSVASIGEQKPNSDAKVFEVVMDVLTTDTTLKPAMTTSCKIYCASYDDVVSIPIESVFGEGSVKYAYVKRNGKIVKQLLVLGISNETHIVVEKGIEANETILLNEPSNAEDLELTDP